MITVELKDLVLGYLIKNEKNLCLSFDYDELAEELNTAGGYVYAIMKDLNSRGHLELNAAGEPFLTCTLEASIFDFWRQGGYKFEDEIAMVQLEKLKLELQSLEGSIEKVKFDYLMTTVGTIISALGLIKNN